MAVQGSGLYRVERLMNRTAAGFALFCLLATACSCSSHAGSHGGDGGGGPYARGTSPGASAAPAGSPAGDLGFGLANYTGSTLRAVYLSPSDSAGWEENVLGEDELKDGNTFDIRFSPEERAVLWDMRVEAVDGHYAEWKGLDLRGVSRITLLLNLVGETVVVAEVE